MAFTAVTAPPPETASAPLVVGVETSVTAAVATAAQGMPVMTVRISWPPIAGMTTGMKTASMGLAGRWRSVVAIPDLPHRPGDVVTVVMVSITVVDILQKLTADEPQLLAPRVDTAVNVLVGTARARSSCHLGVSPAWASSRHISC